MLYDATNQLQRDMTTPDVRFSMRCRTRGVSCGVVSIRVEVSLVVFKIRVDLDLSDIDMV